jgi:glycosyltransferase involved in cell wall biosynthesis
MTILRRERPVRVLHLPCNTPYIRKLMKKDALLIANTLTNGLEVIPSELTFRWLLEHENDSGFWQMFDICHIHYGFEFEQYETVQTALQLLQKHDKPVVYTCHELDSVHGISEEEYGQYQKLILDYSSAVVTLTQGCRKDLQERFPKAISAKVIPHGYVVDPLSPCFGCRVEKLTTELILFGALRPNRDYEATLINLSLSIAHECKVTWLTRPFSRRQVEESTILRTLLCTAVGSANVQIETILPLNDSDLATRVGNADILLLPYRFAGHSGQMELAFDCGVLPVVTDVGYLREQSEEWPRAENTPGAFLCDWTDGKEWLYQTRLMESVREAVRHFSDFASSMNVEARKAFRIAEHEFVLDNHLKLYTNLKGE